MNLTQLVVSGLNRYISLDRERALGLNAIDNKAIKLFIRELDKSLIFKVQDLHVNEIIDDNAVVDVEINVSLKVLPEFALGVEQDRLIKNGGIEIKGDTHVASVFQNVLKEVEIDWEEQLSKYTGDAVAYQAGKVMKEIHSFGQRLRSNFREDLRDYMQDEVQVVATREEVDEFVQEVDSVRAQTDRIEARIKRLQTQS